jgi:hypothetical protein
MPYANPNAPAPPPPGVDPNIPGGYTNYFLNNTPEAGWWSYLQGRGLAGNGNDPRSTFARNQYGNTYGNFLANAAENPNEGFYDYLQRKQPNFEQDFMAQDPNSRGDNTSRTLTPKARFVKAY